MVFNLMPPAVFRATFVVYKQQMFIVLMWDELKGLTHTPDVALKTFVHVIKNRCTGVNNIIALFH